MQHGHNHQQYHPRLHILLSSYQCHKLQHRSRQMLGVLRICNIRTVLHRLFLEVFLKRIHLLLPLLLNQFVPPRDPFDTRNVLHVQPIIQNTAPRTVDWGTKENAAPQMHHANSFTTNNCFGDNKSKWEERKVTSLEEAFTKLVDMNALASLNALGAVPMRPAPVVMANRADPFGDDFFR
ncbi:hypothetical protein COOONC_19814 [Cooperia oncophora]